MMNTDLNNNPYLVSFIEGANKLINEYWTNAGLTYNDPPVVMVESEGRRYAKLAVYEKMPIKTGPLTATRVYCFYDKTNGDLLKGDWKAPVAKGVRGNVNEPNVLDKFNWHGPKYLRGGN
jgi:hypothetical protein